MEDNRPNQDLTNQDIEFIKEKVKERPLNRRKLFKKTLLTSSLAKISTFSSSPVPTPAVKPYV